MVRCLAYKFTSGIIKSMAIHTKSIHPHLSIPVTLEQIAQGLRGLSSQELETLEILLDRGATDTIRESMKQAKAGKLKRLS